jgi:ABC-type transport system substrate-binding protein
MTLAYTNGLYPGDNDIALAVVDQLNRVNIHAKPLAMENGVFTQGFLNKSRAAEDALLVRATAQNGYFEEVANGVFACQGPASFWCSPEFDQLLSTARVTVDTRQRADVLRRAQLMIKDEAPAITLFTAPNAYGMSPALQWTPRPDGLLTMYDATWRPQ